MRLELTGRHVDITPALRRLVDMKLAKLGRLLNDSAVSAQAVLTLEKHRHRTEITLHARGEKFLHGVGSASSWEASVGDAIDKIGQQAQKVKGKWKSRKRRRGAGTGPVVAAEALEPAAAPPSGGRTGEGVRARMPRILRTSRQAVKAMSVADAARELESRGDGLVVFRDAERASISVIYRQRNGELALVETEL
ncbi:MAG: ribosome hibernation-promoting factor, HPF/YfiA family [Betaproteobacteria bacterium]